MPRFAPLQDSFNAGEYSDLLDGNIQAPKRSSSLVKCLNFIPLVQGPVIRRGGNTYLNSVKYPQNKTTLIDFQFNSRQSYQIEFGDQYMRFYRNKELISNPPLSISGTLRSNPVQVIHSSSGYTDGDWVTLNDIEGMTELNGRQFIVTNVTGLGYQLLDEFGDPVDGTNYNAYISGGTASTVYEIPTPYMQDDLYNEEGVFLFQRIQSGNVLYIVHKNYPPKQLVRVSDTSWILTDIIFRDGPYLPTNENPNITIDPSTRIGNTTLVSSSPIFASTDIGRFVRLRHGAAWGYCRITAFISSTQVDALVISEFGANTSTSEWRLGRWSDTTVYPNAVSFYQDRLCFASGADQSIDLSVTGDYVNFSPTKDVDGEHIITPDSAISITLNARRINEIQWLIDNEKGLVAGSTENEWIVRASNLGESVTPSNIQATRISGNGNCAIPPEFSNVDILFVDGSRKKLHQLDYSFTGDKFITPDLTTFNSSIAENGFTEITYQKKDIRVMWGCTYDGLLVGITYTPEQEVFAWHRHIIGGYSDQLGTKAKVESVSISSREDNLTDELYMIVQRWVNGRIVRYVECQEQRYDNNFTALEDAILFDSNFTYKGEPTEEIAGLDHLEGQTVSVLADGAKHIDVIVEDGKINLTSLASTVQIGLKSKAEIITQRLEGGTALGTSQGRRKQISQLILRVKETLDIQYGIKSHDNLIQSVSDRMPIDKIMGTAPVLYTGDINLKFPSGLDKKGGGQFVVSCDGGFPATILMISADVVQYDNS